MHENNLPETASVVNSHAQLKQIAADVASMKSDVDRLFAPLVESIKRDRAFDELQQQLRKAEKVAQAWRDAPLITGIHDAIVSLRQSDAPDNHLISHLEDLLYRAGVEEFGKPGETVSAEDVEITQATGHGAVLTVAACKRPGLRIGELPLRRSIVEIIRTEQKTS